MSFKQQYSELPDALFQSICPEQVVEPELVVFNHNLSKQLILPKEFERRDANFLSGNKIVETSTPFALGLCRAPVW